MCDRQFKELRGVLNDAHKAHRRRLKSPSKSPPAKPLNIKGRIDEIRPFQKVWVMGQITANPHG